MNLLQECVRFLKDHWPHVLLAIPGVLVVTVFHEAAHCAAAGVQGGDILEFAWLPSRSGWGHMRYAFPPGAQYSSGAISLAPYVGWVVLCFSAVALALRPRPWPFWIASTIFMWLFAMPLADIANAALPYALRGAANDLWHAFGPARPATALAMAAFGAFMVCTGFPLQKRLYRGRALSVSAYAILSACAVVLILGVTVWPRR